MNQKTAITIFAIFIGAMMILSAFAGFVMRGGDETTAPTAESAVSPSTFGVQGRTIDISFGSLENVLEISPESTVAAFWIDLQKSKNLTDAAREAFPMVLGLNYGDQIYQTKVEKMAAAYFNDSIAEFHWIKPFRVAYDSFVIPYEGYMMIPQSEGRTITLGTPTLFGPQRSTEDVLDVISGGLSTEKFTLPMGESADFQLASLGRAWIGQSGKYQEFYLGISVADSGFNLSAKYLGPNRETLQRIEEIGGQYDLAESSRGDTTELSGNISREQLKIALKSLLSL